MPMHLSELKKNINWNSQGNELYRLIERLYPICRSITGNGVRETLTIISEYIPLTVQEIPSGSKVFDWTIPDEWNIKDAYIKNSKGERIVDFKTSNLHVLNYSIPVEKKISLNDLKEHLYTLPEHPDWIPYRTSYHHRNWGFCLTQRQLDNFKDETFHVKIDSSLKPGHLTYGEYFIPGEIEDEILITCHVCHPSLSNDNLSGISIATFLAKELSQVNLKYSYRFLFIPGTIGAITWLSKNEEKIHNIKHGLVLALLGDKSKFHYKKSRRGDTEIDRTVIRQLKKTGKDYKLIDFEPYGYDERQFCSPGFNLPVGRFSRTPNGEFPEYHTSADNMRFVEPSSLSESMAFLLSTFYALESAVKYINTSPKCEPQLGKRGLFKAIGGQHSTQDYQMALLWALNLSDSKHTLEDIVDASQLDVSLIEKAITNLVGVNLLKKIN